MEIIQDSIIIPSPAPPKSMMWICTCNKSSRLNPLSCDHQPSKTSGPANREQIDWEHGTVHWTWSQLDHELDYPTFPTTATGSTRNLSIGRELARVFLLSMNVIAVRASRGWEQFKLCLWHLYVQHGNSTRSAWRINQVLSKLYLHTTDARSLPEARNVKFIPQALRWCLVSASRQLYVDGQTK